MDDRVTSVRKEEVKMRERREKGKETLISPSIDYGSKIMTNVFEMLKFAFQHFKNICHYFILSLHFNALYF